MYGSPIPYMPIIQYIKANTNDTNQYKTVGLLLAKASQTFNVTLNIPVLYIHTMYISRSNAT